MSEAFVTEVPLVEAAVGEQALLASCNITVLRLSGRSAGRICGRCVGKCNWQQAS